MSFPKAGSIDFDENSIGGGEHSGADEYVFKVPIVGASGVGKTVLLKRIAPGFIPPGGGALLSRSDADMGGSLLGKTADPNNEEEVFCDTQPTLGCDFASRLVVGVRPETNVRLQLWDVAGIEKYASANEVVLRNAAAAIVVYDVGDVTTLEEAVDRWFPAISAAGVEASLVVLVGNKTDVRADAPEVDQYIVTYLQGKKNAKKCGIGEFMECSARKNDNCETVVTNICEQLMKKFYEPPIDMTDAVSSLMQDDFNDKEKMALEANANAAADKKRIAEEEAVVMGLDNTEADEPHPSSPPAADLEEIDFVEHDDNAAAAAEAAAREAKEAAAKEEEEQERKRKSKAAEAARRKKEQEDAAAAGSANERKTRNDSKPLEVAAGAAGGGLAAMTYSPAEEENDSVTNRRQTRGRGREDPPAAPPVHSRARGAADDDGDGPVAANRRPNARADLAAAGGARSSARRRGADDDDLNDDERAYDEERRKKKGGGCCSGDGCVVS